MYRLKLNKYIIQTDKVTHTHTHTHTHIQTQHGRQIGSQKQVNRYEMPVGIDVSDTA